jgi:hypothetical protein
MMVRRRVLAGVAVVVLIIIVLVINGCVKSGKLDSLHSYNKSVAQIGTESETQVSKPLFVALSGASGKSAIEVEVQVNQLRLQAHELATRTKNLSAPGEMEGAQRALVTAMNLRDEGMTKIASLVPQVLGGNGKAPSALIAGDMEMFLASDVLYSQRVVPLIQETLASNGIHNLSTPTSRFLPNLGWLEASTVFSRITGQQASTSNGVAPGTHGSALLGVSVGANTLTAGETLNHISGGGNPTFTVAVENTGSNPEVNVKVDITVTAGGKQYKASHVINQTQPGSKVNVEIPVTGIATGVASRIEAYVEPVPGETETENNKMTFLAIFAS